MDSGVDVSCRNLVSALAQASSATPVVTAGVCTDSLAWRAGHATVQEKVSGNVMEDPTQLARAAKELILSHDREVEAQKAIMQLQRDLTASDRCRYRRATYGSIFSNSEVRLELATGGPPTREP